MQRNPILEELYTIRHQIMADHGDDLTAYLHSQFEQTKSSGHPIARIKQRTLRCTGAAKADRFEMDNQSSPPRDR